MCLIVFAWRVIPGLPLVACANRDEYYDRPATPAGPWPDAPDIRLDITASEWSGIGDGYGHLYARRVEVSASGRRAAARARHAALWLPGPNGAVEAAEDLAPVHVLRGA